MNDFIESNDIFNFLIILFFSIALSFIARYHIKTYNNGNGKEVFGREPTELDISLATMLKYTPYVVISFMIASLIYKFILSEN